MLAFADDFHAKNVSLYYNKKCNFMKYFNFVNQRGVCLMLKVSHALRSVERIII